MLHKQNVSLLCFIFLTPIFITPSFYRIVRWFAQELGVKLNKFVMEDINTFYQVHGLRKRTYAVKANPAILKYKLRKSEKGKSPDQLLQQALKKVQYIRREEGLIQHMVRLGWVVWL